MMAQCKEGLEMPEAIGGRHVFKLIGAGLAVCLGAAAAAAEIRPLKVDERIQSFQPGNAPNVSVRRLQLTLNKSQVVEIAESVSDAIVGAPDVADVLPVTDRSFYM